MDVTNLILNLNGSLSNNTLDLQLVTKAIKLLEVGAVIQVETFSDLPLASENIGRMYLVNFDGLYVSNGNFWNPIESTIFDEVYSWGTGLCGQLGNNTGGAFTSPTSVSGTVTNWCQLSSFSDHSIGIRRDGTAWAWGVNSDGRLGDNTITNRSSPVSVVGGFSDWCQVSAGGSHSVGVRRNGTVWTWGLNTSGQLGDGTTTSRRSPVQVVGGFTEWSIVSAGGAHTVGILSNGSAWAWGLNSCGQVGDLSVTNRSSPVEVCGCGTTWCAVSAGLLHTIGILFDEGAYAWGNGGDGQLGNNTTLPRSSPGVITSGTCWCQISSGNTHSLGIWKNGTAWAWGNNGCGKLGTGDLNSQITPVQVIGGFTDWCQVSAGNFHSLGVRSNGTAWAWGGNNAGQLGVSSLQTQCSPVQIFGGFTDWCFVNAALNHSNGIRI